MECNVKRLKTVLTALTLLTAVSLIAEDDANHQVRQTAAAHEFQITLEKI
jgi:hypothetical protein